MQAVPARASMLATYAQSTLKRRIHPVDFEVLRSRVRRFSRDSLVAIGTRAFWYFWKNPDAFHTDEESTELNTITWAHAAGVIGLACIYAAPKGRAHATEADFRVLAYELFECPNGSHLVRDAAENAALLAKFRGMSLREGRERLRHIPEADIPIVHLASFFARAVRKQIGGHLVRAASRRVRSGAIYELIWEEANKRGRVHVEALRKAEHAVLRTDHVNYMRALLVLRELAHHSADQQHLPHICPGAMLLEKNSTQVTEDWGDTRWEDVLVTAERLATPIEEPRESIDAVSRLPAWERAFSEQVWLLRGRPLILLPSEPDVLRVLAPNPWLLEDISERELLYEVPAAANSDDTPFLAMRGDAFQSYLRRGFGSIPGVIDVDSLAGIKASERRPDFVWIGERFGIVVEAKMTLSPQDDLAHRSNSSVLRAWALGCEAIEQGCAFLRSNHPAITKRGDRMWMMVIVTMEPNAADSTYFVTAAKRWSMLDDSPFAGLHVADVAELEHFALTGSADDYGELISNRWATLVPDFRNEHLAVQYEETRVVRPISDAWDRFFSATSNQWTTEHR